MHSNLNVDLVETNAIMARRLSMRTHKFPNTDMRGSDFVLSDCTGSSFEGSCLVNSNFSGATLKRVNFKHTDMSGTILSYSALDYSDMTGANLFGASDTNTSWEGVTLTGAMLPEGWTYEEFVSEVAPAFYIRAGIPLKSVVSDRGWSTGPIELAYPKGVPKDLRPVEHRMRVFMKAGLLRRAQVTSALRKKGALR